METKINRTFVMKIMRMEIHVMVAMKLVAHIADMNVNMEKVVKWR